MQFVNICQLNTILRPRPHDNVQQDGGHFLRSGNVTIVLALSLVSSGSVTGPDIRRDMPDNGVLGASIISI